MSKLTLDKAKELRHGDILHHLTNKNANGTPQRWKVNGKVKRWKRSPDRIEIPLKYGLYRYDYLTDAEFVNGICAVLELEA